MPSAGWDKSIAERGGDKVMRCVDHRHSPCGGEMAPRIRSGVMFTRCDKHYVEYLRHAPDNKGHAPDNKD